MRTVRLEQEGAGRSEVTQTVCSCRRNLHPVCGVDGNTYNNECLAKCAEIAVDCQGECPCQQLAGKLGSPDQDKPRRSQEQVGILETRPAKLTSFMEMIQRLLSLFQQAPVKRGPDH